MPTQWSSSQWAVATPLPMTFMECIFVSLLSSKMTCPDTISPLAYTAPSESSNSSLKRLIVLKVILWREHLWIIPQENVAYDTNTWLRLVVCEKKTWIMHKHTDLPILNLTVFELHISHLQTKVLSKNTNQTYLQKMGRCIWVLHCNIYIVTMFLPHNFYAQVRMGFFNIDK